MTKDEQTRNHAYLKAVFETSKRNLLSKVKDKEEEKAITKEEFLKSLKNTISFTMMSIDDIRDDLNNMQEHLDDLNYTLRNFIEVVEEYIKKDIK